MRSRLLAALLFASLSGPGPLPAHAGDSIRIRSSQITEHRAAPARQPAKPGAPSSVAPSPWTSVGPDNLPGRFHCVGADLLNLPNVATGSDGSGYWWGYGLADLGWQERGKELGGGILQIIHRLVFPAGGGSFQRVSVLRTDGQMFHSDDDGITWQPDTLNVPPGYTYNSVRKLGVDSGSINVGFLLVYATNDVGDDGVEVLRSFDGGSVFDPVRFVPTRRADLWASRTGTGMVLLAYETGGDVQVERSTDLADTWTSLGLAHDPSFSADQDTIVLAAQEAGTPDSMHVWMHENGRLQSSVDGGTTWNLVRPQTVGSARGMEASILNPDLIVWTGNDSCHYSRDGGVTDSAFVTWAWPVSGMHPKTLDVDCFQWNLAAAPSHHVRSSAAGPAMATAAGGLEQFFISTGGGVWRWQADMAQPELLTQNGVVTQGYNQLYSLRDGKPYDIVGATNDAGILAISAYGPPPAGVFWTSMITSSNLDISQAVTCYRPDAGDPVGFGDFPFSGITTFGNGVFTGVGETPTKRHNMLVADPVGPYAFYFGSDALYRSTWNRAADTWSTVVLPSEAGGLNGDVTGFAIAPSDLSRWYLSTANGNLYSSNDSGGVWNPGTVAGAPALPIDPDQEHVRVVVNPDNPLEAWVVGTNVLRTTDGGANWSTETTGLPAPIDAWDLSYDGTPAQDIYLASTSGPYKWSGAAWIDLAPSGGVVPAVGFRAVDAVPYQAVMRFGTWGRGVWDYATGSVAGVPEGQVAAFWLAPRQSPIRGTGTLEFSLPRAEPARLEVLDIAGRRVATLLSGRQPAGPGRATFDAERLAAGVYFARLTAREGIRTARIVLLR